MTSAAALRVLAHIGTVERCHARHLPMYTKIPNAIRKYRLLCVPPVSQRKLGLMVGMSQTRISKYELGVYLPSLEVAVAIAFVLRMPVEKIFYGVGERALNRVQAMPHSNGEPKL